MKQAQNAVEEGAFLMVGRISNYEGCSPAIDNFEVLGLVDII